MTLRFIHTADWQLGRPFSGFEDGLAAQLRAARVDVIDRIADHARASGATHVLVAGDVWDQETPSEASLRQPLDRLARAEDLVWWLLPGNHDPARPQGLWHRLHAIGLPGNVRPCVEPTPVALEPSAWLLPAPLATKHSVGDPSQALDAMATPAGALRIGLAHGSITSFGDETSTTPIAVDRAQQAGLAYLALGDWHGRLRINAHTWYAGTPEPDRFPTNDPGWCLSVTVDDRKSTPTVTPLPTARFRWRRERIDWASGLDVELLNDYAGDGEVPADRTLVSLQLAGSIRLAERAALHEACRNLGTRLAYLDVDDGELRTVVEGDDLDRLGAEGGLKTAAGVLAERAESDPAARRALDLLFTWSLER